MKPKYALYDPVWAIHPVKFLRSPAQVIPFSLRSTTSLPNTLTPTPYNSINGQYSNTTNSS